MAYADDPEEYKRRLEAKFHPRAIRSTLAFAGLYQITHEVIKRSVLDGVRNFYMVDYVESGKISYEQEVVNRPGGAGKKNVFKNSLAWLVQYEAITQHQADRLDVIYEHRHDLAHELIKYVVDPDHNPNVELFAEALTTLKALDKFFAEIEISLGSFEELGEVSADDVLTGSTAVLQSCIHAYLEEYVEFTEDGLKTKPYPGQP